MDHIQPLLTTPTHTGTRQDRTGQATLEQFSNTCIPRHLRLLQQTFLGMILAAKSINLGETWETPPPIGSSVSMQQASSINL